MKQLHFEYDMTLAFDSLVEKHRFTLKCFPHTDERQEISQLHVEVFPNEFLCNAQDSFGNSCIYGYAEGQHDHFSVHVTGHAKTGLASYETAEDIPNISMYKYQTPYTKPGDCLKAYRQQFAWKEETTALDKALVFMKQLYQDFHYEQGVTNISTTAEEALVLGKGVCQDYSHIMLSLCRMERIPSRYVVGMLMGEGLSHAWVEICSGGRWIALDPTNNLVVDTQHIKISSGRDYQDCIINQGVFTGFASQTQEIQVSVKEIILKP
ncbi:MAG TPA: transglutaminase family protein [Candidatus Blautia pullicola]|jgi:transglutaminase-like putative cysteine protease|uniref:Transglutaminase family protein n=1 Tax=Candidatus Blautia pullicola TaxID=2838498 RepID=A0A9D2JT10_9FIRM|nr:transglutaminase family protein [Candidatus Blautia pullicola]